MIEGVFPAADVLNFGPSKDEIAKLLQTYECLMAQLDPTSVTSQLHRKVQADIQKLLQKAMADCRSYL